MRQSEAVCLDRLASVLGPKGFVVAYAGRRTGKHGKCEITGPGVRLEISLMGSPKAGPEAAAQVAVRRAKIKLRRRGVSI